ncbi:hypothetical protein [uncultured Roseobacter sp.]|uniref:hypothetical protein n=1 Tax=uncultured Roseobacter sp. TaxID=114847 RepID=UPI002618069E|nr:hypothetical protein [uncultured Roseobacter sp.]
MTASKTHQNPDKKRPDRKKPPTDHCGPDGGPTEDPKPKEPKRRRPRFDPCRTPPATPYLVIRSWGEDLGVRPIPPEDAASLAYSPDIPFVPEQTPDGSIILQCWITNIGLGPAAPVQIEFFLMPPSITQPGPSPVLVATEHAIISPHTSKLVRTRPLSFPNPFGGGLAQGIVVRCSTPFDRHADTLDPVQDRHVAVMNAWPIIDQAPDVSLGLSNLTARPATARVEVLTHRIRLRGDTPTTPAIRARFAGQDLLEIGEGRADVARHLDTASDLKLRHRKVFRRTLNGLRPERAPKASLQSTPQADQVTIEASVGETARKLFPTADFTRRRNATPTGACDLPPGRHTVVEGIALGAFEERTLNVKIAPTQRLKEDEYLAVHLFHVDEAENVFQGRLCLMLGRSRIKATKEKAATS